MKPDTDKYYCRIGKYENQNFTEHKELTTNGDLDKPVYIVDKWFWASVNNVRHQKLDHQVLIDVAVDNQEET